MSEKVPDPGRSRRGFGKLVARVFSHRLDLIAVFGLLLLLAWFFDARILASAKFYDPIGTDLLMYFGPMYTEAARALAERRVPLWNPYQACGLPFIATLGVGFFYPARLLLLFLDPWQAIGASTILHIALGAVGMFALVRALGWGIWGALVASAGFTYGFSVTVIYNPSTLLEPGVWFPVAALAVLRIVTTKQWRYVALAAVSTAAPVLAGGYQVVVYFVYGIALFGAGLLLDRRYRALVLAPPAIWRILAAGVLALCLSSIQWAPTLLWTAETVRSTEPLSIHEVMPAWGSWRLNAAKLFDRRASLVSMIIPGPIVLLAFLGVLRRQLLLPLALGGAVACLLSMGPTTGWFSLYYSIPGLSMFRQPFRLQYLAVIAASLAAASGVEALRHVARPSGRLRMALVPVVILGASLSAMRSVPAIDRHNLIATGATLAAALLPPALVGPGTLAPVLATLISTRTNKVQLPYSLRKYSADHEEPERPPTQSVWTGRNSFSAYHPTYERLASRVGLWRSLFVGRWWIIASMASKQGMVAEMYMADDYDPLVSSRLEKYFALLLNGRLPDRAGQRYRWRPSAFLALTKRPAHLRLLDMMSVRYLIAPSEAENRAPLGPFLAQFPKKPELVEPSQRNMLRVYENADALPRAYTVEGIIVTASDEEAANAILSPGFDPRRDVVASAEFEARAGGEPLVEAEIVSYDRERVVVHARSDRGGALVLTDAYAPGWTATVNGQPTPVWPANYLFRGVRLPPGEHRIVFSYAAPGYRAGRVAAVTALAVLGLVPLAFRWRARASST